MATIVLMLSKGRALHGLLLHEVQEAEDLSQSQEGEMESTKGNLTPVSWKSQPKSRKSTYEPKRPKSHDQSYERQQ